MAENKTKPTKESVSAFIATLPDKARRDDSKALVKLMQAVSGVKPKLWGPNIIGFGIHHYVYESGREGDMPLVALSPRKPALVLYLTRFKGCDALLAKLGKHTSGKSCLYIKRLADIDLKIPQELIAGSITAAKNF